MKILETILETLLIIMGFASFFLMWIAIP